MSGSKGHDGWMTRDPLPIADALESIALSFQQVARPSAQPDQEIAKLLERIAAVLQKKT